MAKRFLSNISVNDQYTLPSADGTSGQIIQTDGSGNLSFVDFASDEARKIIFTVKNKDSISLSKGTVVHASPSATPPSGNVIEVIRADNDDSSKMPAIGILNETLAVDAEGECVMLGSVSGIATNSFNIGDELYVSDTPGEFTNTKPTGTSNLIQKIAIVIKSHSTNGLIEVFGAGRSNDVPNLVDRTINFSDNAQLRIGDDSDLRLVHDGADSFINSNGSGDLYIQQFNDDKDILFRNDNGSGGLATYMSLDGSETRVNFFVKTRHSDNVKALFGGGGDLEIYHDGTNSIVTNNTGDLRFINNADDKDITFYCDNGSGGTTTYYYLDGSEQLNRFQKNILLPDGVNISLGSSFDLQLYHDGGTESFISNITGNLIIQNTADDSDIIFKSDDGSGGVTQYFRIDGGANLNVFEKDIFLADNIKALFGSNSDLQIYHDGSNSYIKDAGTGNLWIQGSTQVNIGGANGEIGIQYVENADVTLRHNNVAKLSTTSTGVTVTGTTIIDQTANTDVNGLNGIRLNDSTGTIYAAIGVVTGNDLRITAGDAGGTGNTAIAFRTATSGSESEKMRIDNSGQVQLNTYGSGTFTGTATYRLAVDSSGDVIEIPIGDGAVDGSGAAGQVAVWSDTDTITGYTRFKVYDSGGQIQVTDGTRDIRINSGYGGSTAMIGTVGSHDLGFMTANSQRVTIDSSGSVGIGTTSPTVQLDIEDSSNVIVDMNTTTANANTTIRFQESGSVKATIGYDGTNDGLILTTGGFTAGNGIFIDDSQNVGIGTDSPTQSKLVVDGTISIPRSEGFQYLESISGGFRAGIFSTDTNATGLGFNSLRFFVNSDSTNPAMVIGGSTNTKNVGIGTDSPTSKLHLFNAGYPQMSLESNGGTWQVGVSSGNDFAFRKGASGSDYPLWLDSSGNVGIGTTSPATELEISKDYDAKLRITSTKDGTWVDEDNFGSLEFYGKDTSGLGEGIRAAIRAKAQGTFGIDTNLTFSTSNGQQGLDQEWMRITDAGRIGIGTDSPNEKLEVAGNIRLQNSGRIYLWRDNNNNYIDYANWIASTGSSQVIQNTGAGGITFKTGTSARMFINSSGNVGIGTTSPSEKLVVQDGKILAGHTNTRGYGFHDLSNYSYTANTGRLSLVSNGTEAVSIDSSQNVGIGTDDPQARLTLRRESNGSLFEFNRPASSVEALYGGISGNHPYFYSNNAIFTLGINNPDGGLGGEVSYITMRNGSTRYTTFEAGNVGIGTTSPNTKLEVRGGSGSGTHAHATFTATANRGLKISTTDSPYGQNSGTVLYDAQDTEGYSEQHWLLGGSTKMVLNRYGRVGIGTTSPSRKLHIVNTDDTRGILVENTLSTSYAEVHLKASREFRIGTGNSSSASEAADRFYVYDATASAHRFTIDSSGNVGIGTTSPSATLELNSTTGNAAKLRVGRQTTATNYLELGTDGGSSVINAIGITGVNASLIFNRSTTTTTTESMRINANGNLGINETDPLTKLHITDEVSTAINLYSTYNYSLNRNWRLQVNGFGSGNWGGISLRQSTTNGGVPSVDVFGIDRAGNVGIGINASNTAVKGKVNIQYDMDVNTGGTTTLTSATTQYGSINFSGVASQGSGSTATTMQGLTWQVNNYSGTNDYGVQAQLVVGNNGSVGTFMGFFTSDNYSNAPVERIRIDSSGNVGIQNTSPSSFTSVGADNLVIGDGLGNNGITVYSITNGYGALAFADGTGANDQYRGLIQYGHTANSMNFFTDATEKMRITSTGRVGIGTTNPYGLVEIYGNGNSWSAGPAIRFWDSTNSKGWLVGNINNQTAGDFYIRTLPSISGNPGSSNVEFTIKHSTGRVGIGTLSPDGIFKAVSGTSPNAAQILIGYNSTSENYFDANTQIFRNGSYAEKMRINSSGQLLVETTTSQTTAKIGIRQNGSSIEFGHDNQSYGYYGTLGATYSSGHPFIAFACYNNSTIGGNNFATQGHKGNVIYHQNNGDLIFAQALTATSSSQGLTERMRLKNDGSFGIGKDPNAKLNVKSTGSTTDQITLTHSGNNVNIVAIGQESSHGSLFLRANSGVNKVRLSAAGNSSYILDSNVGIGVTSPGTKLHISGNSALNDTSTQSLIRLERPYNNGVSFAQGADIAIGRGNTYPSTQMRFILDNGTNSTANPQSTIMALDSSGNVGIGTTSPDHKLVLYKNISYSSDSALYSSYAVNSTAVDNNKVYKWRTGITGNQDGHSLTFSTIGRTESSYTERMRITDGGVFIQDDFHITSTSSYQGFGWNRNVNTGAILNNSMNAFQMFNDTNLKLQGYNSSGTNQFEHIFYNDGNIFFDGNVGIGVTSPGGKLHVNGNTLIGSSGTGNIYVGGQTSGQYLRLHHNNSSTYIDANGAYVYFRATSGANTRFRFGMSSDAGTFIAAGDVVAYGSPSDKTLKENIKPIENALDKVSKLKGVEFDWKKQDITNLKEDIGFIAQDVQEVLPQLVRENENGKLSLRHQGIVPVLVEAIKELTKEIETLKTQINN